LATPPFDYERAAYSMSRMDAKKKFPRLKIPVVSLKRHQGWELVPIKWTGDWDKVIGS